MERKLMAGSAKWYAATTYSGQEKFVKEDLLQRAKALGVDKYIKEVLCPFVKVQVKNPKTGQMEEKEEMLTPGYVYINMILDEDGKAWYVVRNTPKVTGIYGSSGSMAKPVPLPTCEMDELFQKIGRTISDSLEKWLGKRIEILDGSMKGQKFVVAGFDDDKRVLKVEMSLFGDTQTIDLDPNNVKEIK
jgi:transcriptional antiterminator NusG